MSDHSICWSCKAKTVCNPVPRVFWCKTCGTLKVLDDVDKEPHTVSVPSSEMHLCPDVVRATAKGLDSDCGILAALAEGLEIRAPQTAIAGLRERIASRRKWACILRKAADQAESRKPRGS